MLKLRNMRNRREIEQIIRIAVGEAIFVGLMLSVYGMLGKFSKEVFVGAMLGSVLAVLNFLVLSMVVVRAAERAQQGEVAKATIAVQSSSVYRLLGMGAVLVLAFKAGVCDPLAALLPLLFVRMTINFMGFFEKESDDSSCK